MAGNVRQRVLDGVSDWQPYRGGAATLELVVPLSPAEARVLTDEVKSDAAALWAKLLRLYEGGAHTALGYSSWGAYYAAEFGRSKSDAYRLLDAAGVVQALQSPIGEQGYTPSESVARELVPVLKDDAASVEEVWAEAVEEHGPEPTAKQVRGIAREHMGYLRCESVEWYTPAKYIEAARRVLGAIDLDPASCLAANETVRAARFYAAEDDGLSQPWAGRVWVNPPYGGLAGKFVARLLGQHTAGHVTAAIALVNASTDAGWFQSLWDHALCFTDHRVDFTPGEGQQSGGSAHGSVLAYLGPTPDVFEREFARFGAIVDRRGQCTRCAGAGA